MTGASSHIPASKKVEGDGHASAEWEAFSALGRVVVFSISQQYNVAAPGPLLLPHLSPYLPGAVG
jgi:hypothetical protein